MLLFRSRSVDSIKRWKDLHEGLYSQNIACHALIVPKAGVRWENDEDEGRPSDARATKVPIFLPQPVNTQRSLSASGVDALY
jgi:hypothetical protein